MSSKSDCLKRSNDSVISPINSEFLQTSFEKEDICQINDAKLDFFQSFCCFRTFEVLKIEGFKICETRSDNYAVCFIINSFYNIITFSLILLRYTLFMLKQKMLIM